MELTSLMRFLRTVHFVMEPASCLPGDPKAPIKDINVQSICGQHGGTMTILRFAWLTSKRPHFNSMLSSLNAFYGIYNQRIYQTELVFLTWRDVDI